MSMALTIPITRFSESTIGMAPSFCSAMISTAFSIGSSGVRGRDAFDDMLLQHVGRQLVHIIDVFTLLIPFRRRNAVKIPLRNDPHNRPGRIHDGQMPDTLLAEDPGRINEGIVNVQGNGIADHDFFKRSVLHHHWKAPFRKT